MTADEKNKNNTNYNNALILPFYIEADDIEKFKNYN